MHIIVPQHRPILNKMRAYCDLAIERLFISKYERANTSFIVRHSKAHRLVDIAPAEHVRRRRRRAMGWAGGSFPAGSEWLPAQISRLTGT